MRVILNSDILYQSRLVIDSLSTALKKFFTECAKKKHTVVIPSTVLLEFEKAQTDLSIKAQKQLTDAYSLLERYGIVYTRKDPSIVFPVPDLIELIKQTGVTVEVEKPTIDDYEEAHRRACLHQPPQPPDTKSDEMRDLVIWMIALRIAKRDGEALLVSNDVVHVHQRGDDEAKSLRLARAKNLEGALEYLGVETLTRRIILRLLRAVWSDLVGRGFPAASNPSIILIARVVFVQGQGGPTGARFDLSTENQEGKTLRATVALRSEQGILTSVALSGIMVDGILTDPFQLTIILDRKIATGWDSYNERLGALRLAIEG